MSGVIYKWKYTIGFNWNYSQDVFAESKEKAVEAIKIQHPGADICPDISIYYLRVKGHENWTHKQWSDELEKQIGLRK